jgi:hypothetical protein
MGKNLLSITKALGIVRKVGGPLAILLGLSISLILPLVPATKVFAAGEIVLNWTGLKTIALTGSAVQGAPLTIVGDYQNTYGGNGQSYQGSVQNPDQSQVLVTLSGNGKSCKTPVIVNVQPTGPTTGAVEYSVATSIIFMIDKSAGATCDKATLSAIIPNILDGRDLGGGTANAGLKDFPIGNTDKRAAPAGGASGTVKVISAMGPASENSELPTTDQYFICASTGPYATNKDLLDKDCLAQKAGVLLQSAKSGGIEILQDQMGPNGTDEKAWRGQFANKVPAGNYDVCSENFQACLLVQINGDKEVMLTIGLPNAKVPGKVTGKISEAACDNANFTELNFWVCGLTKMLSSTAKGLDNAVIDLLKIDTDTIFNDSGNSRAGTAYFVAWASFRNIAYAILVLFALVMIASQVLGMDFMDAYTFRKMLPRLIIAVILIAVSWNALDFVFNLSNDAADAIRAIIAAPFHGINITIGSTTSNDISLAILIPLLLTIGVPTGVAALALLGVGGIAALFATIVLSVFSAWILLVGRNVVADLLIIMSPIAIIFWAFGR